MNLKRLIPAFLALLVLCTAVCFAEDAGAADSGMAIKFVCTEPDDNGVFHMTVSFDRMKFITYQFAVRYDASVVEAYDEENKRAAETFEDFAQYAQPKGLNTIGETLLAEQGIFDFSGYCMPNDTTSGLVKEDKEALTDENFLIYTLTFRQKTDGDCGFQLALADGNGEYYSVFPQGASVYGFGGVRKGKAVFTYGGEQKTEEFDSEKYSPEAVMTKARRLKDTLYLQSGNYAAACDGVLSVIEKDNKSVAPKLVGNELYVPLRFVCEYFGFEVTWDDEKKSAVLSKDNETVSVAVSGELRLSSETKALANKPYIENERMFVALSDVKTLTALNTYYYTDSKSAVITSGEEWQPERDAESEALEAMQFVVSPFIKFFV